MWEGQGMMCIHLRRGCDFFRSRAYMYEYDCTWKGSLDGNFLKKKRKYWPIDFTNCTCSSARLFAFTIIKQSRTKFPASKKLTPSSLKRSWSIHPPAAQWAGYEVHPLSSFQRLDIFRIFLNFPMFWNLCFHTYFKILDRFPTGIKNRYTLYVWRVVSNKSKINKSSICNYLCISIVSGFYFRSVIDH